jgi:hypothetical protein
VHPIVTARQAPGDVITTAVQQVEDELGLAAGISYGVSIGTGSKDSLSRSRSKTAFTRFCLLPN